MPLYIVISFEFVSLSKTNIPFSLRHLLQHKSWHVGSIQNQERVRRDERNAKLKEEEEERRMQEIDAERRMKFLRQQLQEHNGDENVTQARTSQLNEEQQLAQIQVVSTPAEFSTTEWGKRDRTKKRRRGSEGDEDGIAPRQTANQDISRMKHQSSNAPLVGGDGHINLFPPVAQGKSSANQNPEYLADKAREAASFEAQYTMQLTRPSQPWYATVDSVSQKDKEKSEKRKDKDERLEKRVREENDPLKNMRRGLSKLKEVKAEQAWERRQRDADVGLGADEKVLRTSEAHRDDERRARLTGKYEKREDVKNDSRRQDRRERHDDNRPHRPRDDKNLDKRSQSHRNRSPKDKPTRARRRSDSSSSVSPARFKHGHRHSVSRVDSSNKQYSRSSAIDTLREEAAARQLQERRKAEALIHEEKQFRAPERWSASSGAGRGKYSRQFGS